MRIKLKMQNDYFPKSLTIAKEETTDKKSIAEIFNGFYVITGKNLAAKILLGTTNPESYLPNITTMFQENYLTEEELKNAFFQ